MARTPTSNILVAASLAWCLTIVAAPLAPHGPVYEFFRLVCHQDPTRSWILKEHHLPVCIRCASIYFGFLAAVLAGFSPKTLWLRWCLAISCGEFIMGHLLLDSALLRSVTGALLGAAAAPFVRTGLEEMWALHESV